MKRPALPTKLTTTAQAAEVRRCAEEQLKQRQTETVESRNEADTQRLVHELQVHQIELEMQNEELRQLRDAMEVNLEKYTDLYDFAPVGYLTLDRAGMIGEANLTAARLLGIDRSRLIKRRLGLYVSPADVSAFNAFLARVFEGKGKEFCEITLLKEWQPPVEARLEATLAASGQECRAVLADITAHNRAEADHLILSKLESTGILAGGLAHDFNNLLTVNVLNLELAKSLSPPGDELARCLEEAKNTALTARALTDQLITFASGGVPMRKLTHLAGLIRESVRTSLSGSRVRCEFSLPNDLRLVEIDEGQIGQALRNMVLNAREAMLDGGTISVRAENLVLGSHDNPSLSPGDYVRISITDRGTGIAKEVLPKIFDPYFSTKQRGTEKGMGLGLTICHSVIQKHGGAISVKADAGIGTTFHVYLPASRKVIEVEKAARPKAVARQGKILVMDDEVAVRKLLGALLHRMGHEVESVEDGQMALEVYERAKAQGQPFDAVILDLTVRAGVGGLEAMKALLKIDPAVKAIVMSGYSNDPAMLEPERYGFQGALTKPFGSDALHEIFPG